MLRSTTLSPSTAQPAPFVLNATCFPATSDSCVVTLSAVGVSRWVVPLTWAASCSVGLPAGSRRAPPYAAFAAPPMTDDSNIVDARIGAASVVARSLARQLSGLGEDSFRRLPWPTFLSSTRAFWARMGMFIGSPFYGLGLRGVSGTPVAACGAPCRLAPDVSGAPERRVPLDLR
jgi:hypothetical protein